MSFLDASSMASTIVLSAAVGFVVVAEDVVVLGAVVTLVVDAFVAMGTTQRVMSPLRASSAQQSC